jgi:hypothetical protein
VPVRRGAPLGVTALAATALTTALAAATAATAAAQPPAPATPQPAAPEPAAPPGPRHRVVVAPLATLGAESSSADVRAAQRLVVRAVASLPSVDLVGSAAMLDAIKRAHRPGLRTCDGDTACLVDLGQLLSAEYAIYGEVGGLGRAQVVYLKLVDVQARTEVRSAVLELGGARPAEVEASAAATRLLAPGRYVGRMLVDCNVRGASIFVDGELVARSPARPLVLAVGSHALRVTHPESRDFVRFVDVEFAADARVAVDLRAYRAVAGDIRRNAVPRPPPADSGSGALPTPWYRRWYTIAGGGALLLVTSAVVVGLASGGLSFDLEKDL